jgi:hypothetical protein
VTAGPEAACGKGFAFDSTAGIVCAWDEVWESGTAPSADTDATVHPSALGRRMRANKPIETERDLNMLCLLAGISSHDQLSKRTLRDGHARGHTRVTKSVTLLPFRAICGTLHVTPQTSIEIADAPEIAR